MSDFKAKMHQIRFLLGLCPRPRWGAYSFPPDPYQKLKGLLLRGKEKREGEGEGEGKGKRGREEEGKGELMEGRRGEGICRTSVKLLPMRLHTHAKNQGQVSCFKGQRSETDGRTDGQDRLQYLYLPSKSVTGQCKNVRATRVAYLLAA